MKQRRQNHGTGVRRLQAAVAVPQNSEKAFEG